MLLRRAWILLILSACVSTSHVKLRSPSSTSNCMIQTTDLSKASITALVNNPDCKINSVETFLTHIDPTFFAQYALAYQSESLQGPKNVDYLNPRAIVYGNAANLDNLSNFVMTFNSGRPTDPGGKSVEMVEFNPKSENPDKIATFFELEFSADGHGQISDNNPAKCIRCHDSPAKPIFNAYPFWTGFYGSMRFPTLQVSENESQNYQKFLNHNANHPRYKLLKPMEMEQTCIGTKCDITNYYESLERSAAGADALLARYNGERSVSMLMYTPEYRKTKYAVAAALLDCDHWIDAVPQPERAQLSANIEILNQLKARITPVAEDKLFHDAWLSDDTRELPFKDDNLSYPDALKRINARIGVDDDFKRLSVDTFLKQGVHQDAYMPASLRLLMEARGIRIDRWFLPLQPQTYHIHDGGTTEADGWLKILGRRDPEMSVLAERGKQLIDAREHRQSRDEAVDTSICTDLIARSQAEMKGLTIEPIRTQILPGYPRAMTVTCADCHTNGSDDRAPFIPFDNPNTLSAYLLSNNHLSLMKSRMQGQNGRAMPPSSLLTPADKAEIENFLQSIH